MGFELFILLISASHTHTPPGSRDDRWASPSLAKQLLSIMYLVVYCVGLVTGLKNVCLSCYVDSSSEVLAQVCVLGITVLRRLR